ncbi:hypothetical protein SGRIM128S_04477 [Streptomyces griseomycini]
MPPDSPISTDRNPFLVTYARSPTTSAEYTSSSSSSRSAYPPPSSGSYAGSGVSDSTTRSIRNPSSTTPVGASAAAAGRSRSTTTHPSVNCGARVTTSPSRSTTIESPSKTRSSCPPVIAR